MNNETYFTIFSQRLAGWLMCRGFCLVAMDKNDKDQSKNVFFFRDSAELRDAVREYTKH